jgi:hypothetical protein
LMYEVYCGLAEALHHRARIRSSAIAFSESKLHRL